jgi:predicted RNase H-like nuclease
MSTFVGIDGIPGGWVAVYLRGDGSQRFAYARSAAQLLSDPYCRAMIDMPIGLPERGYRQCDIEARALVGSRVFVGARWGVWKFKTLDEANAHYWGEEGIGRGISMQLFCIREKLQELNEAPIPSQLFEAHPEMIFWRIAGRVLDSKNTRNGREERIELLESKGIRRVRRWLDRDSTDTVPVSNGLTEQGFRAEIWY